MKVLEKNDGLTVQDEFKLCLGSGVKKLSEKDGQNIKLAGWVLYEDDKVKKSTGEVTTTTILALMDENGECFGTNSDTVISDFQRMREFFSDRGMTVNEVRVASHTSKNNRTFYTLEYVS